MTVTGKQQPARGRADLRSLARGGTLNMVGAAVTAAAQFLAVAAVTRGFSPREAGIFFAATTVFLVGLALARLGTDIGLVYHIARARALDATGRAAAFVRTAVPPVLVAATLTGAVLWAFAPRLAAWSVDGDPGHFVGYLRVLAIFLPIAAMSDTALAATRGFREMRPTVLVESIGRQTIQLTALVTVSLAGSGALLGLAWAGPYAFTAVAAALWLRAMLRRHTAGAPPSASAGTGREFWGYTWPRAVAALAQLILLRFDIVLVAALLGPVEAAVYTAATRYILVGQIGNQALGQAVAPQLSEVLARGDRRAAADLYQTATAWLVLITWPLYLMLASFAPFALRLFGEGYETGADVVLVLSLTMLFATICGQVDTVLIMAGRTTWNLANIVTAMTVNIVADLILIPRIGIVGAAAGWAIALVVKNVVPLAQIAFALRLHPFGRGTLTAAALAALSFGLLPLAVRLTAGDGFAAVLAAGAAGLALYAAGCRWRRDALRLRELRRARRGGNRPEPAS
ncbi:lipopolysaccharide biosynthesis protein [Thermomonospora cellulosilytica]|uniref:O-antigen/teichoic acid export membrane protein n=1 Tax=Thermomonospora cellulosilytica TaxID=1411118 RepID=A0A7W3R8Q7_9ACTN|nr:polysaccharide biosynthesis C-terminal domain-containing protein [Thermomonospora cellulosilytica]MBA9003555.1 O-antigen/teichoic acid export membrane protein [Thermomonospora cellulosilytica]